MGTNQPSRSSYIVVLHVGDGERDSLQVRQIEAERGFIDRVAPSVRLADPEARFQASDGEAGSAIVTVETILSGITVVVQDKGVHHIENDSAYKTCAAP